MTGSLILEELFRLEDEGRSLQNGKHLDVQKDVLSTGLYFLFSHWSFTFILPLSWQYCTGEGGGGVKKKNSTISIPPVHFCFIFKKKKSFIYFLILFIRRRNGKRKRIHAWSTYMQNLLWENGCHSISSMWSLSVLRAVCPSAEEVSNVSSANQRIDKGHIWNLKLP